MTMRFDPRWIVGKTVAAVHMNAAPDGRGGVAHDPWIYFTDGSHVHFQTQETETGDYGTAVIYVPRRRATHNEVNT